MDEVAEAVVLIGEVIIRVEERESSSPYDRELRTAGLRRVVDRIKRELEDEPPRVELSGRPA